MDQIEALQRRVATVEEENGQLRQRLDELVDRVDNLVAAPPTLAESSGGDGLAGGSGGAGAAAGGGPPTALVLRAPDLSDSPCPRCRQDDAYCPNKGDKHADGDCLVPSLPAGLPH